MRDFASIGVGLGSGVYILTNYGKVVWVGQGKCVLAKVYAHLAGRQGKGLPALNLWRPMEFDDVQVRTCRVDQLDEVFRATCIELGWHLPASEGASVAQLDNVLRAKQRLVSTLRRRA